jgi:uncharacterized protein YhbP (UPF0306 family)
MEQPDKRITEFIAKHHVLTLATEKEHKPWCATCFYSYRSEDQTLIFTSDMPTRHITEILLNPFVAGSIVLETKIIGKIQGIQLEGKIIKPSEKDEGTYKRHYISRFPFAILNNSSIWVLQLTYLKFTDNRLGFGKKLIWENTL